MDVKDFLNVVRLSGEALAVCLDHVPVGGKFLRVELHLAGVSGTEYHISDVDVGICQQGRHVDVFFAPVVNEVGEYHVDLVVLGNSENFLHKYRHVVVIFSGHAHQRFVALFQSGISWRMSKVVVSFGKYGEADARFIGEHGHYGFDDAIWRAVGHHVGGPVGGSLRAQ